MGIRAANPGPFTLSGTNTWIVGSGPAWLVDPGPALPEHHRGDRRRVGAPRRSGRDRADARSSRPCRRRRGDPRAVSTTRRWQAGRGRCRRAARRRRHVRTAARRRDAGARAGPFLVRPRPRGADRRCGAGGGKRVHRAGSAGADRLSGGSAQAARAAARRAAARPRSGRRRAPRQARRVRRHIAWTASDVWWRRWRSARAPSTSCSTPPGPRCPRCCDRRRR